MSEQGEKIDPNAWMTTFSDLVMLLLSLFVLLLSMKSIDAKKIAQISNYRFKNYLFQNAMIAIPDDKSIEKGGIIERVKPVRVPALIESCSKLYELTESLSSKNSFYSKKEKPDYLTDIIDVSDSKRGIVITMESDHIFNKGCVQIKPDKLLTIDKMGNLFTNLSNDILILSYTKDLPETFNNYESGHEVSFYRSLNIYYYLADSFGINAKRIAPGCLRINIIPSQNGKTSSKVEFVLLKG